MKQDLGLQHPKLEGARLLCRAKGLRMTEKRAWVLHVLIKQRKPMSAYEICDDGSLQSTDKPTVMTIYRILGFWERLGVVHRLLSLRKFMVCHHFSYGKHDGVPQFLICDRCTWVEEISPEVVLDEHIRRSLSQSQAHFGFKQLEIYGRCARCSRE